MEEENGRIGGATMNTITAERLRDLLDYQPDSGKLIWRQPRGRSMTGDIAGRLRSDGYISVKLDQRDYPAHRLIWFWIFGQWPTEIDHINRCRSDNRIENLRECTRSQNFANRGPKKGRTLPKGIRKQFNRYAARIVVNGKEIYLGKFLSIEEATAAYSAAALKHYGEFGSIREAGRER